MKQLIGLSQRVCARKQWVDDEDEGYGPSSKEEFGSFMNPITDAEPDDDDRYLSA